MMPNIKSVLKPEGSVMAGLATAGTVYAIYQLDAGSVANVTASDAYHPANTSALKKAGWTAFILVSALTLITRDGNVGILGYASIVAMDVHYKHANMTSPMTGTVVPPTPASYEPAQDQGNVIPMDDYSDQYAG